MTGQDNDRQTSMKFGSSASKGVRINRKEPQKLGTAVIPPPALWVGAWLTIYE